MLDLNNQIIVQEMVTQINSSGVAFTKDIENGSDYYVINYDDVTGKTNTVTSGQGHYSNRILYIYKKFNNQIKSQRFKKLIDCIKDLEKKIELDTLDIEFAINNKLEIYLLQARPISTANKWDKKRDKEIDSLIFKSEKKVNEIFKKKNKIYNSNTILGNMPDWNPVEIIGKYPSQLSVSLYKFLITDNIWAKARSLMGYKNITGNKLMYIICGQPYIDTRLSLYSFLPKSIKSSISKKIVNHGINLLKKFPFLHDKIEFEISVPSFDFSSNQKIEKLFYKILKKKEKKFFLNEIKRLTKKVIENKGKYSIEYCIGERRLGRLLRLGLRPWREVERKMGTRLSTRGLRLMDGLCGRPLAGSWSDGCLSVRSESWVIELLSSCETLQAYSRPRSFHGLTFLDAELCFVGLGTS